MTTPSIPAAFHRCTRSPRVSRPARTVDAQDRGHQADDRDERERHGYQVAKIVVSAPIGLVAIFPDRPLSDRRRASTP
jgi:hypothetical protein